MPKIRPGKPAFLPKHLKKSLVAMHLCLHRDLLKPAVHEAAQAPGFGGAVGDALVADFCKHYGPVIALAHLLNGADVRDPAVS